MNCTLNAILQQRGIFPLTDSNLCIPSLVRHDAESPVLVEFERRMEEFINSDVSLDTILSKMSVEAQAMFHLKRRGDDVNADSIHAFTLTHTPL